MRKDTIAAISTPIGQGGIGIIRVSGENAFIIVERIFKPKISYSIENIKTQTMKYGHIIEPISGQVVDEVLVSFFKSPHSYTCENMIEINCHGGTKIARNILELVLKYGAGIAEPGEFTKRAFLNGRIDLLQAEAVIEIINSKTNAAVKASQRQLEGRLSIKIREIRSKIIENIADIEAAIDYPEYDIEEISRKKIRERVVFCLNEVQRLINTFFEGRIIREGIQVAIVGRPNVGKSSLLNALAQKERSIITEVPGTTRDIIEEFIEIGGIAVRILDTAGLRETEDYVEKIGIERTRLVIDKADLILLVLDGSEQIEPEDREIFYSIKNKKVIVLINKSDIGKNFNFKDIDEIFNGKIIIDISAKEEHGLEKIEESIKEMFINKELEYDSDFIITNVRHKQILEAVMEELKEVIEAIDSMVPIDLISVALTGAGNRLGEITGETVNNEVLETIFHKFCIGK